MYIYTFAGLSIVLTAYFYAKSSEKLEEEFDNTTKNKGYRIGLTTMTLSTSLPLTTYLDASKNLADWADLSTLQQYFCCCYCFTLS